MGVKDTMNRKEKSYLLDIYRDCIKLTKLNQLTEFGLGQLLLSTLLLNKKITFPLKITYTKCKHHNLQEMPRERA